MANSKKNKYVLQNNLGTSIDKFRNAVGNYWKHSPGFPQYGDPDAQAPIPRHTTPDEPKRAPKSSFFKIIPRKQTLKRLDNVPFFQIDNNLDIYGDKSLYGDVDTWIDFVKTTVKTKKTFYDYGADISVPLAQKEVQKQNSGAGLLYRKADFNYNYYAKLYETMTGDASVPENILPDIYFFARNQDNEDMMVLFESLTAGGNLDPGALGSLRESLSPGKKPDYFDKFGNAQSKMTKTKRKQISKKTSNLIFDTDNAEFFKIVKDLETLFPMSVDIQFMSDELNQFTEVLDDSHLATSLMSYLALLPNQMNPRMKRAFGVRGAAMERYFETFTTPKDEPPQTSILSESDSVRTIDLFVWMTQLAAANRSSNPKLTMFEGEETRNLSRFEKFMYLIVFSGKLQTLIERYQRSFLDISDGAPSYSETICYKIEKSLGQGAPIQTVWMPNTNEIDLVRYIDTQVKYNKTYKYKISAYQFVLGSEYQYSDLEFPDSYETPGTSALKMPPKTKVSSAQDMRIKSRFRTPFAKNLFKVDEKTHAIQDEKYYRASLKVAVRPCVKIVQLPFFEVRGRVIDDPPVPPHIDIVPYRAVEDKLLINMNTNVGEYRMDPVIFTKADAEMVESIRNAKRLPKNGKITFSTDDSLSAFEIYRTRKPPTKIEDFADNLRVRVNTDVDSKTLQKASSASFVDNLDPNTDYYYTFRAIDIHGKISNPTDVYKIQLVNNDGAIYPLIEIYQIKKIKPQKPTKSAKKLLNIAPTIAQTMVNYRKSQMGDGTSAHNIQSLMLGQENRPLFGETFKIRLTSRQTGRKIDLNLNFKVELDKKQK